jgi:hypothetical protein
MVRQAHQPSSGNEQRTVPELVEGNLKIVSTQVNVAIPENLCFST